MHIHTQTHLLHYFSIHKHTHILVYIVEEKTGDCSQFIHCFLFFIHCIAALLSLPSFLMVPFLPSLLWSPLSKTRCFHRKTKTGHSPPGFYLNAETPTTPTHPKHTSGRRGHHLLMAFSLSVMHISPLKRILKSQHRGRGIVRHNACVQKLLIQGKNFGKRYNIIVLPA